MEINLMVDETMVTKEVKNCRCLELEERVLKAEEKCIDLETEIEKEKNEFESLVLKFKELESGKLVIEEELRNLKESEESSLIDQMMVNKALEFEKQMAEKQAEDWKRKFEKLVETVQKLDELGGFRYGELELDENVKLGLELARIKLMKSESCEVNKDVISRERLAYHQISGSPCITTPIKDYILGRSRDNMSSRRRVNKMLTFEDDCHEWTDVVDLCDSETEERSEKESADAKDNLEEKSIDENYEHEDMEDCEVTTRTKDSVEERNVGENYEDENVEASEVNTRTRKRKRVINSDSENDDDEDNIPILILKKLKPPKKEMLDLVDTPTTEENRSGRSERRVSSRLRKLRASNEISASSERYSTERLVGIPTTGNVEDDETEKELESEGESLDGFIVDDDDDADDGHETVSEKSDDIVEEESDGETGYADVMSRLRRDKKPKKLKWEYEADMLADFGKDTELCMRAVCVMYRFQSEDEKLSRSSHHSNGRGFSKFDAARGTRIGNFLTDGDPEGDLKKSVEELESFEFEAVETCRALADKYSKQLFQIYNNREDPFFTLPPSP